ncbi:hypothetical protein FOZ63_013529, partial [Perkinsus olseni]
RCHSRLGDFLQLQERYPQACEEFERALEICEKCNPPVREKAVILLRLGECQRQGDKEKGKKTLLTAKALLDDPQQRDEDTDDVLAAIDEALEDNQAEEMNDQVKIIQQMMASTARAPDGPTLSLGASTSAKFDKATLGSDSK